jgi:hypothetical protein
MEKDARGVLGSFHLRTSPENAVLIKTRRPDLNALAAHPFFRAQPGLLSSGLSPDARELVLQFDGPTSAFAFQRRMNRQRSEIHWERMPGRLDTVLGHPHVTG